MKFTHIVNRIFSRVGQVFSTSWLSPLGNRGVVAIGGLCDGGQKRGEGLLLLFATVLFLASCGSKKNVVAGGNAMMEKQPSLVDVVQAVNSKRVTEPCISAKMSLNLSTSKNSTRVGGSLRMKRNDVIQISLVALGLMEVGRLELTPDYMMLVDRMNHQYVKCDYDEVNFFREAGIDFYTFQSLFWDELFVLNGDGNAPESGSYNLKKDADGVKLVNSQDRNVALTFVLNAANQLVEETRFSRAYSEDAVVKWQYADWTKLGEQDFPGTMKLSFELLYENVEATFRISSVKPDSSWETRTEINKNRYTEVSLDTAFRKIMSLAK